MPSIRLEKCTHCMKCVNDCPSSAIDITAGTIDFSCIHCGHCVAICAEMAIDPDFGFIHPLTGSTIEPDDFRNLSAAIRTCRSYSKKEISTEMLQLLVDNMAHYPSASNARPLKITILRTPEFIQKLNDEAANSLIRVISMVTTPILSPIFQLIVSKRSYNQLKSYKAKFISKQKTHTSQICHHAPAVMLFHAPKSKFEISDADAYIWATYTSIYANTLGLGTCFNGFIVKALERNKSLRSALKLPANHQIYSALLIGYPKVHYKNETSRPTPEVNYL